MISDSQLNGYGERYLTFAENSSDIEGITPQSLYSLYKHDHMVKMFLSKLTKYDIIRVIYYTYFLSKGYKQDDIFVSLSKIFMFTILDYENPGTIDIECGDCYGEGLDDCGRCGGSGNEDCYNCGGDGSIDCETCNGDGKQECNECGGTGGDSDDECSYCSGTGEESCDDCGGVGHYECHACGNTGNQDCSSCEGGGQQSCENCGGDGIVQSDENHYTDTYTSHYVTLDDFILSVDENDPMTNEDIVDDMENTLLLAVIRTNTEPDVYDIDQKYGTDEWDRVVVITDVEEFTESTTHIPF